MSAAALNPERRPASVDGRLRQEDRARTDLTSLQVGATSPSCHKFSGHCNKEEDIGARSVDIAITFLNRLVPSTDLASTSPNRVTASQKVATPSAYLRQFSEVAIPLAYGTRTSADGATTSREVSLCRLLGANFSRRRRNFLGPSGSIQGCGNDFSRHRDSFRLKPPRQGLKSLARGSRLYSPISSSSASTRKPLASMAFWAGPPGTRAGFEWLRCVK